MARRRRRSKQDRQIAYSVLAILALFVVLLAVRYWYVTLLIIATVGGGVWLFRRRRSLAGRRALRLAQERFDVERAMAQEQLRARSLTLGGLLTLTAREFELRVGEILSELGYRDVEHVGKAGDGGFDLLAVDHAGARVGIQCKRYALDKRVRGPEVRLLFGDMTHAGIRGVLVTTSQFTPDAAAYAEAHRIRLIDGDGLTELLRSRP